MNEFVLLAALLLGERFPCGPLGATAEVEPGATSVILVEVHEDGPASRAGLQVGDQVTGVQGQEFPPHGASVDAGGDGPQRALGEAIDAAMALLTEAVRDSELDPVSVKLRLELQRDEQVRSIEVELPWRPSLTGPDRSKGRLALRKAAAKQLLASRHGNGFWDCPVGLSGDRVITAWAVIALLAHGDPEHADALLEATRWLRGPEGNAWLPDDYSKGPDNLGNWALTSSMVALAEHAIATGTDEHDTAIRHMGAGLVARLDAEGRFGHDVTVGYSGKGFNVINTLAHLAWAMGDAAGIPRDDDAWQRSLAQVLDSVDDNGGIRYWTLPGTGTGDASLRTASMALALIISGDEAPLRDRFVRYLDLHAARCREAHAVGSLGMLTCAPALRAMEVAAYERFLEEWRWYLNLCWGPGDRIHYIGGKGNNGGDSYLGFADVACVIVLQLLACEDGRLRMTRRDP